MKTVYLSILVCCSLLVWAVAPAVAVEGPFASYISAAYASAQMASEAQTLEAVQAYARITKDIADSLQQEAAAADDAAVVLLAQGIYNYAQRASESSSLGEAREYATRAMSYAKTTGEKADESALHPDDRKNYNDREDYSYDYYYHEQRP